MTGPVNDSPKTTTIPSTGTYKGYICPSVDSGKKSPTKIGIHYNGCYNSTTYTCTGSTCTCTGHLNCTCSGSGSKKNCKQPTGYFEHAWTKTRIAANGMAASPIAALQQIHSRTTIERLRHRAPASPIRCFRRNKTPIARR